MPESIEAPGTPTDQQFGDYFSNLSDDCKLAFLEVHPQHWGMFIEDCAAQWHLWRLEFLLGVEQRNEKEDAHHETFD